jgi:hypothetical protein
VDELRVVHAAVREEAAQARVAKAKAREDAARAWEEVAKAREDLAPLLACVKELEEDVASVSGQRDALNIQIGIASARVGTLEDEVATLKGMVRERDEALSGIGREIETLRATVCDKDETLQAAEKAREELHDEVMGWQTHAEGKPFVIFFILASRSQAYANLVFVFQRWRSSNTWPRRRLPRSKTSSRPRRGGLSCSRVRSPQCLMAWGSIPMPISRRTRRRTRLFAGWRCWVASFARRYEAGCIMA